MPLVEYLRRLFLKRRAVLDQETSPPEHEDEHIYPVFPPPRPQQLIANRDHYLACLRKRKYATPRGKREDTPLFVLFRLYEHIVLDNNIGMRNELEAFWWTKIPVEQIADPEDESEPERYAVLSCIPALMVESFNRRIDLGLRRNGHSIMSQEERDALAATPKVLEVEPGWTKRVSPVKEMLAIPHNIAGETQLESPADERASLPFKNKNILLWQPHIHFL